MPVGDPRVAVLSLRSLGGNVLTSTDVLGVDTAQPNITLTKRFFSVCIWKPLSTLAALHDEYNWSYVPHQGA